MWVTSPEVLMWMLFMGTCVVVNGADRDWFLLELRHGASLLDLINIDQFKALLQSFLYRECIYKEYLRQTWEEMKNPP
jgi:hypothetical protein